MLARRYFCGYTFGMARPPKDEKDRKGNVLRIRLTDEERKRVDEAAQGKTSTWAREVLLKAAHKRSN
jgi:hypothetical protein